MKQLTLFLLLFTAVFAHSQSETLNNQSIIELTQIGLSSEVIIEKINTSKTTFDVTTTALIALKKEKVADAVIQRMVKSNAPVTAEKAPVKRASGIYFCKDSLNFIQLDPTSLTGGKSESFGNTVANSYLGGVIRKKDRLIVERPSANLRISNPQPSFNFVFETPDASLNNTQEKPKGQDAAMAFYTAILQQQRAQAGSAVSPNDFILLKIETTKEHREIITKGSTSWDAGGEMDEKQKILFRYEKLADNTYRVYFEKPLAKGEYCFFYANARVNQRNVKDAQINIFDFGID